MAKRRLGVYMMQLPKGCHEKQTLDLNTKIKAKKRRWLQQLQQ